MESEGKHRTVKIGVWVVIIGLLLGVVSSIVMATAADAHAALQSISPADGAVLTAAPTQVVLTFNEPIGTSFATISVAGPDGSVSQGRAVVDGVTVTEALAGNLRNGRYTVSFRVVSEDGHPVSDRTTFSVAAAAQPTTSAPGTPPTPTTATTATTNAPSATNAPPSDLSGTDDAGSGRALRIGLAVGVAALALAGGTALVAASRRRSGE